MKTVILIIKMILCSFLTLLMGICVIITGQEINWQVVLYLLSAFFIVIGIWLLAFANPKNKEKIIFVFLLIIFLLLPNFLPYIKHQYDVDSCIDSGICPEGFKVQTEKVEFIITKESCKKYGYKWNEKRKDCNLR